MTNDKNRKPLEFEAQWAPSDDWPPRVKTVKSSAALRLERFWKKLNPDFGKKEIERLPYKARLKRWPYTLILGVPLSASLLILYILTLGGASYAMSGNFGLISNLMTPIFFITWMVINCAYIGFQVAAYEPGVLKPSFTELWKGMRRNWHYLLVLIAFMGLSDVFGEDDLKSVVADLVATVFIAVILFGVADMKAFETISEDPDEAK